MKHSARTVAFSYDPAEDRIRLAGRCEDGTCVVVWLTRRHLLVLLPRLAGWLDRQSPLQHKALASEAARQEIRHFEHEAAQTRVKSVRRRERLWPADVEFLLNNFAANRLDQGRFELVLAAPDGEGLLALPMTASQLHKFVRDLIEMGKRTGWSLPDPWLTAGSPAAVADGTRH